MIWTYNLIALFTISTMACVDEVPNVILFLTDDQDLLLNSLASMTQTQKLIANEGKTFSNAYVNTPICCPSRSTILTGFYSHHTEVVNNSISGGCSGKKWQQKFEPLSIAAILQREQNFTTFYAGKYLNQYGNKEVGGIEHVPQGYDWWIGLKGNSKYYNYTLSINGTAHYLADKYLTDVLANFSTNFLENRPSSQPFFMTVAPPAPHAPFIPADRHKGEYSGTTALRTPSFNFSSTDKHWIVRMKPKQLPENVTILDQIQQHRFESLLAVDEMVAKIINKLKEQNVLENTYVIFTSDNGFHIGQFGQPWDKRQPYETDIKVPFLIRGPKIPKKSLTKYPIVAVDIAPTILDLAKVNIPSNIDGESIKQKLFSEHDGRFLKYIIIEYWGEGNLATVDPECGLDSDPNLAECSKEQWCKCQDSRNNTYQCVIEISNTFHSKFCDFSDSLRFCEAYDLTKDPFELYNKAFTMTRKSQNFMENRETFSYYEDLEKNVSKNGKKIFYHHLVK